MKEGTPIGSLGKIKDVILSADIYSQHVQLSILGKKKVNSLAGFFSTIIVLFGILGFGIFKGLILLNKTQFETQMASVLRPINYSHPEILQMNEYGFDFALGATRTLTPEIGRLILYHQYATQEYDQELGIKVRKVVMEEEDLELCSVVGFNHSDQEEVKFKSVDSLLCMKNKTNMRFGGSYLADAYEALNVYIVPCQNGSNVTCAAQDYIDDYLQKTYVVLRTANFYFDKDKNNPVQSYIQDVVYFGIVPGITQEQQIRVKISKAIYDNSISPFAERNVQEFPQIEEVFQALREKEPHETYLDICLRLDFFANMYQKKLYSFTDYISELGGLFNVLFGGGRLLMFLFMDTFILQKIIKALFQYNYKDTTHQSRVPLENNRNKLLNTESQTQQALSEVNQRQYLQLQSGAAWLCCTKLCRSRTNQNYRDLKLYLQGKSRIRYDFDIINLFRMLQEFKIIKRILLSKSQRVLLKWQKEFTLYSEDESSYGGSISAKPQIGIGSTIMNPLRRAQHLAQFGKALKEVMSSKGDSQINKKLILGISNASAWKEQTSTEKSHVKSTTRVKSSKNNVSMAKLRKKKQRSKDKVPEQVVEDISQREDSLFEGQKFLASERRLVHLRKN